MCGLKIENKNLDIITPVPLGRLGEPYREVLSCIDDLESSVVK